MPATLTLVRTKDPEGVPRYAAQMLGVYKGLADIFEYFAVVSMDQEEDITDILAGGVTYLDNYGLPTEAKFYPSYAFTNFNDAYKVFWTQEAGKIGIEQKSNWFKVAVEPYGPRWE